MKYYARQIDPEYQESYLDIDTDYINITSNRHYTERVSLLFESVRDALYDGTILDEWHDATHGESTYNTWADALRDIIPPSGRGEYTRAERKKIPEIASAYYYGADENASICALLGIVTGQTWKCSTLRGCSQAEWVYAFYPENTWTWETLNAFETEYFNTGSEWEIHDEEEEPASPAEICGYSVYCHAWSNDGIRAELADAIGCEPADIIMYAFDGYTRTAVYKEVGA